MHEAIIYKLSPLLGGRSEVLSTDLMEALGHMCISKDEEEARNKKDEVDRYINFLSMVHSHPTEGKEAARAREEFMKMIKPKDKNTQRTEKPFEWDHDLIERRKLKQKGG